MGRSRLGRIVFNVLKTQKKPHLSMRLFLQWMNNYLAAGASTAGAGAASSFFTDSR
jgi:hypothetical protein